MQILKITCVLLKLTILLLSTNSHAYNTLPQAPAVKPADPKRINPGYSVPTNPESLTWILQSTNNEAQIPVFYFDNGGRRHKIGALPAGSEVKLDEIRLVKPVIYYSVPWTGKRQDGSSLTKAWIPGYMIRAK